MTIEWRYNDKQRFVSLWIFYRIIISKLLKEIVVSKYNMNFMGIKVSFTLSLSLSFCFNLSFCFKIQFLPNNMWQLWKCFLILCYNKMKIVHARRQQIELLLSFPGWRSSYSVSIKFNQIYNSSRIERACSLRFC